MADKNASAQDIKPVPASTREGSLREGVLAGSEKDIAETHEVFQKIEGGVDFRTVGWPRATVIFLKIIFATGVLSIPSAMYSLGAVGGSIMIVAFGALNTYTGVIQGNFRNNHPECHTLADMCNLIGGFWFKEAVGLLYIAAYVLCTGSGIVGLSVAFNALSDHAACTVWWAFLSFAIITACASIRTFEKIGWLTWAGFVSIFAAVFIVVVGVTTRDRPAAAPQTGAYELGYHAVGSASFASGMTATATIFVSSAGTSAFLPVIAEMRRPTDYRKALYSCMALATAAYLAFSLVVYRWCGQWVANPSLGSAGGTLKKVAYGVGLIGLAVSGCLYQHVAAKYVFVRILRGSRHLQQNTLIHWATWLGCTVGLGAIAFVLSESIVIFSYLVALTGTVCFAPMAISLPGILYMYEYSADRKSGSFARKLWYYFHVFLVLLGAFIAVGGTYSVIKSILAAYANGEIGSAFSCADNSGSTAH